MRCARCGSEYSIVDPCACRKTPTIRPGSSSAVRAASPGHLGALVRLALNDLGIAFDSDGRPRGATAAVLESIPTGFLVTARHLLQTFDKWEHEPPGEELRVKETQRYVAWSNDASALLAEKKGKP